MKKFLFLILISSTAQAKVITLTIPDKDIKIVENDVLDAQQWIQDAWAGKVANCKKRMIRAEVDRSIAEGTALPAGDMAIIAKYFARPDYLSRKQRDALKP